MSLLKRALDKVKQAIDKYQPAEMEYDPKDKASVEKALDILEEEYNHIEEIHDRVHKMRSRFLLLWGLAYGESQQNHGKRRHLEKVKIEPIVDLRELKEKLPRVSRDAMAKREDLAIDVAEATIRLSEKLPPSHAFVFLFFGFITQDPGIVNEPTWPIYLSLLANRKGDQAVADPKPTPGEELPSYWQGNDTWMDEDIFALEVLKKLYELDDGKTFRQVRELDPPLTWGEVLYRFYDYLHENRHDETLKNQKMELDSLFYPPGRRYCFECDRPFTVTKYHPYRSICSSCAAKKKQAHWRAQRGKQSENLQ